MSLASRRRMMLKGGAKAAEPEIDWSMSVVPQDPDFSIPEGWELSERFDAEQYPYFLCERYYSNTESIFYSKYPFYTVDFNGQHRYVALYVSNAEEPEATICVKNGGTNQFFPSRGVTYTIDGFGYAKDDAVKGVTELTANYPVIEVDSNGNKII